MVKYKEEDKPSEEDKVEEKAVEEDKDKIEEKAEGIEDDEDDSKLTEEEKKKKKMKAQKGEQGGESPKEDATASTAAQNTTTPGAVIGVKQDIFVPQSGISTGRMASGSSPSETHYAGKSASVDLQKSPLFVELSKQMEGLEKAMKAKVEALEKSMADRMANAQKALDKIEKFYAQPFYKAMNENTQPEAVVQKSVKKQIEEGNVKFSY